jgi:hypothetical protein
MRWDGPPLEAWAPWRPEEIARRLAGTRAHWYVIGGFAIDLFLGRETREHEDAEIAVPRAEFPLVREALADCAFHTVGGEVRRLAPGEAPPPERHQNWALDPVANEWRVDVMLEPGDADTWVFRRVPSLRAPRAAMIATTAEGIPFLRPQGVLLYKAKQTRPKDEVDFAAVLPALDATARAWLREALSRVHPGHAWIERLH